MTTDQPAGDAPRVSGLVAFRERVNRHPLGVVTGLVLASVTLTTGLLLPVAQLLRESDVATVRQELGQELAAARDAATGLQRELSDATAAHQATVAELERQLASIRLGVGTEDDYLDVASLLVTREESADIPPLATEYDGRHFFAIDTEAAPDWAYEETTELALFAELFSISEDDARRLLATELGEAGADQLTRIPVHRWNHEGSEHSVGVDVAGEQQTLFLPAHVIVQRVPAEDLKEILGLPADASGRDLTGQMVVSQLLVWQGAMAGTGAVSYVDALQKLDRTGYGKLQGVFLDATIDGATAPRLQWDQDFLFIDVGDDMYFVRRSMVSQDADAADLTLLNAWLESFRICTDCFVR
jgi:hypothetical protein